MRLTFGHGVGFVVNTGHQLCFGGKVAATFFLVLQADDQPMAELMIAIYHRVSCICLKGQEEMTLA